MVRLLTRRFGCAAVVAAATLAAPAAPATADTHVAARVDRTDSRSWSAPRGCPDVDDLRARIERRLGRTVGAGLADVEISIADAGGHYVARIELAGARASRTLTSARCDTLADAVAVVVVRMLRESAAAAGPRAVAEPLASPYPDLARRVAIAEPDVHESVVPEPDPLSAPRRWGLGMRVAGVSGIGIIPQVGFGAELALTGHYDWLMGELSATKWLETGEQVDVVPAHVDVGLEVAAVRVGWLSRRLPLRAWLGAETGTMSGGTNPGGESSGRWLAAGAGFGVAWRMTSWARLVGTTEVLAAFERVRFNLGEETVYEPAPVSARTTFGLEVGWQ